MQQMRCTRAARQEKNSLGQDGVPTWKVAFKVVVAKVVFGRVAVGNFVMCPLGVCSHPDTLPPGRRCHIKKATHPQ